MKFFMTGEIDSSKAEDKIDDKWSIASEAVSKKLEEYLDSRDYGIEVESIAIIPIVADLPVSYEQLCKERKLFKRKSKSCDFRLRVDYHSFRDGDASHRERLLVKNVIDSIRILDERAKKDFDGKTLETDILKLFGVKYCDI